MTENLAIDVADLSKTYEGKTVVDHIALRVPRGKIYGFLGPNGSGKTTSIRMICGLLTPDSGRGTCLGFDLLRQADAIKRRVGYMTQKFSYWEDLSVRENLAFVAEMFNLPNPAARIQTVLDNMGLAARADQMAGALSGGWKQRLALAACILHDPALLLLDEPTAGVDPEARRAFWDEIHRLADLGLTVLVSTHYMDEAERCHAIIYIAQGRIVVQGSVAEVIAHTGLSTWIARGGPLAPVAEALRQNRAVTMLAPFGETLHVSGPDATALEAALAPWRKDATVTWEKAAPSLEDAFIYFTHHPEGKA